MNAIFYSFATNPNLFFKFERFLFILTGVVDVKTISDPNECTQMDQGNKLAVLCGDYLLASACNNLSKLQNTRVV